MDAAAKQLGALMRIIRACFDRLKTIGDALHGDLGVTPSMRGVIEHLDVKGPVTVPTIAREKSVSRQNIQVIVDGLVAAGLASLTNNPAHKRSPLIVLTGRGRQLFDDLLHRERSVLESLALDLPETGIAVTIETLTALRRRLDRLISETGASSGE